METDGSAGFVIAAGLGALIVVLALLARWARRRSRGAVITGALLSAFAPDPELEKNLRLAEEARQVETEEDRQDGE